MYCQNCGTQISESSKFCPACGTPVRQEGQGQGQASETIRYDESQGVTYADGIEVSPKSWIAALLLEIFLGGLGIHRFYVGKIGTGVIWLLTLGVFGIGWLVDLIMIACGNFKDKQGRYLKTEGWKQTHLLIHEMQQMKTNQ